MLDGWTLDGWMLDGWLLDGWLLDGWLLDGWLLDGLVKTLYDPGAPGTRSVVCTDWRTMQIGHASALS